METFSPVLEDSQLLLSGLGFEPCFSPKSILTAQDFLRNDGQECQTLETLEQQTFWSGAEGSMFSQGAFPASLSALPGSEEARRITEISGRQCAMLCPRSDRFGLFVKTCLESSAWGNSKEFVWIWNTSVTKHNRLLFQLTALEPSTGDNEYSLWPTPSSGNFNDGESLESWEARRQKNKDKGINGNGQGTPLAIAAKLLPTPRKEGYDAQGKGHGDLVYELKNRLLPTPRASEFKGVGPIGSKSQEHRLQKGYLDAVVQEQYQVSGSLNPRFVEQLQGFPIDHTALKHSEMPACRSRRTRFLKP